MKFFYREKEKGSYLLFPKVYLPWLKSGGKRGVLEKKKGANLLAGKGKKWGGGEREGALNKKKRRKCPSSTESLKLLSEEKKKFQLDEYLGCWWSGKTKGGGKKVSL